MEMMLKVDTAVVVPVNLFPLLDDTDFKTREMAVAYNAAGLDLVWNFVTKAGAVSQTAVTPTDTGGNYDWAHSGDGMYKIEIPASGGASINNDTEGYGWFTGIATGVLPWRSPVIAFMAAATVDALLDGSANLPADAKAVGGTTQTGRDLGASVLLSSGTGTGQVSLSSGAVLLQPTQTGVTIPTVTTLTGHTPQTGDAFARLGAPAGASVSADVAAINTKTTNLPAAPAATGDIPGAAAIADAVWDEALAGHATAGTAGAALSAASAAGDPWATEIPGAYGDGTAGKIVGEKLDEKISNIRNISNGSAWL